MYKGAPKLQLVITATAAWSLDNIPQIADWLSLQNQYIFTSQ